MFTTLASYQPFYLQQSPANPARWYFSTRDGRIYTFLVGADNPTAVLGVPTLVLDVSDRVGVLNSSNAYDVERNGVGATGSEHWGLSSFALHPNFGSNGHIYLQINGRQASEKRVTSMVMRYTLVSTPTGFGETFNRATERLIISQLQSNNTVLHHFGHIAFGPGGFLFIGSGDGTDNAPVSRPLIKAQDCTDLRGKILRLNVNYNTTGAPYTIPPDNPYASSTTCRPEIFATGVRNPWRFSSDTATRDLWVGDVGRSNWEEANRVVKGGNYGWPIYEGPDCLGTAAECAQTALIPPVDAINHEGQSAAAIGGFVYRGTAMPSLNGDYVYSIFPRSELLALKRLPNGTYQRRTLLAAAPVFSSYFTDGDGEIYGITGHNSAPIIQKLVPEATGPSAVLPPTLTATGCFTMVAGKPRIVPGAIPYEVVSPLWSDGSAKKRWVALPDGARITIGPDGDFTFPPGSVLIKEFSYQGSPFETRFLRRHNDGVWQGLTYAWRDKLDDADLVDEDGTTRTINDTPTTTVQWDYPSRGQCFECHTPAAAYALGPESLQLNSVMSTIYPATKRFGNQLATWAAIGLFTQPLSRPVAEQLSLANPAAPKHSMHSRARSYLHANCAGCHRPNGPTGKAIDLRFQAGILAMNACNEEQAAGDITYPGATILTPQNPSLSALSLRVKALGTGQMPPIGRTRVHTAAASVIDSWIASASVCTTVGDRDDDGVPDNADNCVEVPNPNQADGDGDKFGDRCDGDWNGNLVADGGDRADLMRRMGTEFRRSPLWLDRYDLNGDGFINETDLEIFDKELDNKRPGPSGFRL